jgi:competence protein ComEC
MKKIIHWNAYPILWLLLPYVGGIVTADCNNLLAPITFHVLFFTGLLWMIMAMTIDHFFQKEGFFRLATMVFWFAAGGFSMWKADERNTNQHFSRFCVQDSLVVVNGIITDITEKLKHIQVTVRVKMVLNTTDLRATDGNLLLQLKKDTPVPKLRYGDELVFHAKVERIAAPKNPNTFDYQRFLHYKNIHYQSFGAISNLRCIAQSRGHPVMQLAFDSREKCIYTLRKYVSTDEAFAVAAALILGYRDAVEAAMTTAYIDTGAMHLLAVSGMHIGLLYGALIFLFQFQIAGSRTRRNYLRTSILFVSVWGFTLLTGAGASVLRAAAMFSLFYIGRALRRRADNYHIWAVSAFLLLLWNPYQLYDIGFQLSYLAVLGILFYYSKIYKWFYFKSKVLRYAWESLAMGFAAQLMTLPLSLYYFGQFSTYFWLSGLLAIPISTIALYVGICLLVIDPFFPSWSPIFGKILQFWIEVMNGSIRLVQGLPSTVQRVSWVTEWAVWVLYGILICWTIALQKRRLNWVFYGMFLTSIAAGHYALKSWKDYQYQGIIVYDAGKNTVIDILRQKKCHTIYSENCHRTTRARVAEKCHNAMNISSFTDCSLNESYKDTFLFYYKNVIGFGTISVEVLDKFQKKVASLPNNWVEQYVLIVDNPNISMFELKKQGSFKQIIFNTSNQKSNVMRWKKECQQLGLAYHDIGENGAWMLKLNP